jgi:hypothetical protein
MSRWVAFLGEFRARDRDRKREKERDRERQMIERDDRERQRQTLLEVVTEALGQHRLLVLAPAGVRHVLKRVFFSVCVYVYVCVCVCVCRQGNRKG